MQKVDGQKLTEALAAKFASPTRSTRLTVVLGRWLGITFTICFFTGLFSHGLQNPPSWMFFPTSPVWIYQLTQGLHVTAGIAAIPLLLAKLWSVYPELLTWPPVKSLVHGLERASIALFIASSLLQLTTGLINTYKWYPWPFPFRETHYWLAWVIWGSLLLHIAVKLPVIAAHWRRRPSRGLAVDGPAASDGPWHFRRRSLARRRGIGSRPLVPPGVLDGCRSRDRSRRRDDRGSVVLLAGTGQPVRPAQDGDRPSRRAGEPDRSRCQGDRTGEVPDLGAHGPLRWFQPVLHPGGAPGAAAAQPRTADRLC